VDVLLDVLVDGPVLLLSGAVLLLFGLAGLLSTGGAGHTRRREAKPATSLVLVAVGALVAAAGAALITAG
jgi:hypothetical protein